jgi:hypothetical protein
MIRKFFLPGPEMQKSLFAASLFALLSHAAFANTLSDKVDAMSENGRRNFISTLVQQSGAQCPAVQRVFFQGLLDKAAVWNVRCSGKNADFGIVFYDDQANTTRVMPCAQLKELGAPGCFKKF